MSYKRHFDIEKTLMAIAVAAVILLFSYPAGAIEKDEICLNSAPFIVKITGTLIERTTSGPPYEKEDSFAIT